MHFIKNKNVPSICLPATTEATEPIVLFVSEAGAYNPPPYCGNAAVVYADKESETDPKMKHTNEFVN